jgi:hypothetical protein
VCKSIYEVQEGADGDTCACSAGLEWKAGDCKPCSEGFFKDAASLDLCKPCDGFVTGSTITSMAVNSTAFLATSPADCACPKDYFLLPDENITSDRIGACVGCPEGTVCDYYGVDLEGLLVEDGFWRTSNKSTEVSEEGGRGASEAAEQRSSGAAKQRSSEAAEQRRSEATESSSDCSS